MIAVAVVLLAGLGVAGEPARADGATLFVNDSEVLTFKTGAGEFAPAKRAESAAKAVNSATAIEVVSLAENGYTVIRLGERKVLTIDATEARAHRKSIDSLSRDVSGRLQGALDSLGFMLCARKVWMPVGGTAQVGLVGPAATKTTVKTNGAVKAEQSDGTVTVSGELPGEYTVRVAHGRHAQDLLVNVMLPAATIGAVKTAYVAGRPADKATVANAAARAVLAAIDARPGAQVTIEPAVAHELVPSQKGTVRVRAKVTAPKLYPIDTEIEVEVRNEGVLDTVAEELWYSNHPENIREAGRLYWGRLQEKKAARVLYHHQNTTPVPIEVKYWLVNTHDEPARIAVTLGDAPTHLNPTYAGYMAGEEFFPRWVRGSASVIEVPPHTAVPVVWESLDASKTASGLMALQSVEGSVLFIGEATASQGEQPPGNFAYTMPNVSLADSPFNLAGRPQHVYAAAEKALKVDYRVGERWGYIRIGQQPVKRVDDDGGLDGNFGVIYRVECVLTNPTESETEIEFLFESSAGYTGAFFRINEVVYRTPLLQPKTTHQFLKVKLAPGESKTYFLETIPLSGGSYPCTVTIKPVGVG